MNPGETTVSLFMKIFLSYKREENKTALKLIQHLSNHNIDVWIDQHKIKDGHWDVYIEKAIQEADFVIVLVSPLSNESPNVKNEISYSLSRNKKIIPLKIKPCEIPLQLHALQFIDCTKNFKKGLEQLLFSIGLAKHAPEEDNRIWFEKLKRPAILLAGCVVSAIIGIIAKPFFFDFNGITYSSPVAVGDSVLKLRFSNETSRIYANLGLTASLPGSSGYTHDSDKPVQFYRETDPEDQAFNGKAEECVTVEQAARIVLQPTVPQGNYVVEWPIIGNNLNKLTKQPPRIRFEIFDGNRQPDPTKTISKKNVRGLHYFLTNRWWLFLIFLSFGFFITLVIIKFT
jgi:TIR domain